ncbi:hypothetical protein K32_26960 [Kaistia sp. 32K]|uniref:YdcF family protein n=1 Tax=Kaistia sp. 32K TaxID=2795690 RepID=UPI0019160134|nr:YdcF family protein [Kaistia sp. 32K]BCP54079.1 hypothetical protein K32_26960 [Kaistia sp. 32K]
MFFYAAKLIWFLLQPSAALLIALAGGVLIIGLGGYRFGAVLVLLATVGLLVAGFSPLGPALLLPLEERFQRVEPDGPVTGILVLGGGIDQHVGERRGTIELTEAGDRMTEAVALARRFPEARVVFSGGSAEIISDGYTEGAAARRFFRAMGLPDDRVTIEDASRNTAENARFTAALVGARPDERWLLVTSAFHMPRAMGSFRAAGWSPLPWPTDYRTRGSEDLYRPIWRPSLGLSLVDVAAKEWVGLLAYWLTGQTDALFPGPFRDPGA